MRGSIKDLTGQRFGRLVVLGVGNREEGSKNRHTFWKCKCDCGKEIVIPSNSLISGKTKSCGCFRQAVGREKMIKKLDTNGAGIKQILNCNINSNNTSGYKGVNWNKKTSNGERKLVMRLKDTIFFIAITSMTV